MLSTRIATAAVLVPLVVAAVIWLPTWALALVVALLLVIAAWEWAGLLGLEQSTPRSVYSLVFVALLAALYASGVAFVWLFALACLWWLAVVYWLLRYPYTWAETAGRPAAGAVIGLLVLCATAAALPAIHEGSRGAGLLLVFLVLIWGADTGAYFAGRAFGRHKLAPNVSPGKSIEGAAGGVLTALIVAAVGASLLSFDGAAFAGFVLLGGWIAVVSIIGDLTLSMFKRHAGIKDSGSIFPGHGGMLDRIDSLLAAAPWFAAGLLWLQ